MLIHLNWNSIAQLVVIILFGSFVGNLLSILTDKAAFEENEIQDNPKILKAVSSSIRTSLYTLIWFPIWIAFFIFVPLYWHSIH